MFKSAAERDAYIAYLQDVEGGSGGEDRAYALRLLDAVGESTPESKRAVQLWGVATPKMLAIDIDFWRREQKA
jgi:hypothetical protein